MLVLEVSQTLPSGPGLWPGGLRPNPLPREREVRLPRWALAGSLGERRWPRPRLVPASGLSSPGCFGSLPWLSPRGRRGRGLPLRWERTLVAFSFSEDGPGSFTKTSRRGRDSWDRKRLRYDLER